jgi:endonuclease/exonuclease/phosphatase family metal-dependent hydrolase
VKRFAVLAFAGLLAAGCQSDRLASPFNADSTAADGTILAHRYGRFGNRLPPPSAPGIRVMTYNVYLGTDLNPILASTTQEAFLIAAARAYGELQQSDFPARAGKIADQIAEVRPDVVGLQEVALWSVSAPYDPTQPPLVPFVTQYDFLKLVLDSLRTHHLFYIAASVDTTSDVSAPAPTEFDPATGAPTAFALVRFQDRDVILVRRGVRFRDPRHARFQTYIPLNLLGTEAGLYRGWCSVVATVDGQSFRFVNTHLEAESPDVNLAQANEMVALLKHVREPVVLVGDFNSDANVDAASYAVLTGEGFRDVWQRAHPHDPGLTNGPNDGVGALDASGALIPYPSLEFTTRVDLVLVRDRFRGPHDVSAAIFGNQQSDRTAGGLWPSDHAAVGAVFELPTLFARRR